MKSIYSIHDKRKYLIVIFLGLVINSNLSCKKNDPLERFKNNEVKATVVYASGNKIFIHATGSKVRMGCDVYGISSYVEGTDEAGRRISFGAPFTCVKQPDTYTNCNLSYHENLVSHNYYENNSVYFPGSLRPQVAVTFTVVNDRHWEGSFNGVCWLKTDTVLINGTFKGERN